MCRDRRRHYDDGFMRVVADLIRGGAGRRSLARRLGVPVSTAGKWVLSYRFGGEAALMGEREGNRRYDYETKLAAVRDHVEHGLTKAEVMEKYRIAGPARWSVGAASTGPAARTRCVRNRRAGPGARNPSRGRLPQGNSSLRRRTRTSRRGSRTWKKSTPCWRGDRQPGQNGDRLHAGGAGTSAPAPAQGGRTGEKHVLPSSVASGRRDPAGHRADGRRDIRAHAQRVRAPADSDVPRARVRGAGEPQERAEDDARDGDSLRHQARDGLPQVQLVPGRDGRTFENLRGISTPGPWRKLGTDVTEFKVAAARRTGLPTLDFCTKEIVARDVSATPTWPSRRAPARRLLRRSCPRTPTRPCTRTGAGSTGTPGARPARGRRHPPEHDQEGQLHRQRRDRAGVRPRQGRVLRRTRVGRSRISKATWRNT